MPPYFVIHILQKFYHSSMHIWRVKPILKIPCAQTQPLMVEMSRKGN